MLADSAQTLAAESKMLAVEMPLTYSETREREVIYVGIQTYDQEVVQIEINIGRNSLP